MRRILLGAAFAAVVLVPFVAPAHADHACDSTTVDAGTGHYVIVDNPENEHGGVWIYAESNGEAGAQRNDDSCAGDPQSTSDTVVF